MPVVNLKLGFIGAGMMASAMINAIIAAKVAKPEHIVATDIYKPSLERLSATGIRTSDVNIEAVKDSEVVILAVKPDLIPSVLTEIKQYLSQDVLIISIAASVQLTDIEQLIPGKRVVRVMPNTPCLVSESAAGFTLGQHATAEDREVVEALFGAVGYACEVKESQLDAVTGLSGSGPAYIFVLIDALADGGVRMGLPRAMALKLAAQTVKGAATMVLETGTHPGVLKDQVCSPGGTTIAAVEALEKNGFRAAAISAVVAATTKSMEMRNTNKKN